MRPSLEGREGIRRQTRQQAGGHTGGAEAHALFDNWLEVQIIAAEGEAHQVVSRIAGTPLCWVGPLSAEELRELRSGACLKVGTVGKEG